MSVYQDLCQSCSKATEEGLQLMGYGTHKSWIKKVNALLNAGSLENFLAHSAFDLVHTHETFLLKAAEVFEVDKKALYHAIKVFRDHEEVKLRMPTVYIYVNTEFKRTNEPIFALEFLEHKRRIQISKEVVLSARDEGLAYAKKLSVKHYQENSGTLALWGKIINYHYVVNAKRYIIDLNGHCIGNEKENQNGESKATLYIR